MKGTSIHRSSRPIILGKRVAAASAPKPPRHSSRLKLRLLISFCLLLAALLACREIPPLFELRLESDSSASLFGYMLSRAPGVLGLWQGLALLLYGASVWMLISVAYRGNRWLPRLAMLAVALAMEPLYRDLRDFGVHWLVLFSISLSFLLHDRKSDYGAGLMLAVAVLIQPYALAAPIYFLWRRRFAYGLSALVFAALMTSASWLLYGTSLLTFDLASLRSYASSFTIPWQFAEQYSSIAIISASLDSALLILLVASLPILRGSVRNRLDYLFACLCITWFTPTRGIGELLLLLVCLLMMSGIVAEKYVEAAASLRFAALERSAAVFAALSFFLLVVSVNVHTDRLEIFISFLAVKLLLIPAGFLAWKLGKSRTNGAIRLSDYRLRRDLS